MNPSHSTSTADFLIAEYQSILDRSLKFEEVKANRINFYLFLVGAVLAGFGSLLANPFVLANIYPIGLGIALFLGVLGWQTLMHSVQYSVVITALYRLSGRARRYFYEQDPDSLLYLAFEPADNKPSLLIGRLGQDGNHGKLIPLLWRGGEPILLSINAIMGGIVLGLMLMWVLSSFQINFILVGILGLIMLGLGTWLVWAQQIRRVQSILAEEDQRLKRKEFHPLTPAASQAMVDEAKSKRGS